MTQLDFTITERPRTQCEKIEAALQANAGQWVSMPDLWRASGAFAVHSRISDLRKKGLSIEQRQEKHDGQTWSFYRLV